MVVRISIVFDQSLYVHLAFLEETHKMLVRISIGFDQSLYVHFIYVTATDFK